MLPEVYNFDAYGTHLDVFLLKGGEFIQSHRHDYEHKIFLAHGEVTVALGDVWCERVAPSELTVPAEVVHSVYARTDAVLVNIAKGEIDHGSLAE